MSNAAGISGCDDCGQFKPRFMICPCGGKVCWTCLNLSEHQKHLKQRMPRTLFQASRELQDALHDLWFAMVAALGIVKNKGSRE